MASTAPTRMRQQTCEPGDQTGKGRNRFPGTRSTTWILAYIFIFAGPASGTVFKPSEPTIDFDTKIYSACSIPMTSCPLSDKVKEGRERCMFAYMKTCPEGTYYGCGVDDKTGFRVEDCFEKHLCPPGSSNRVRLDLDKRRTYLECVACDKDHFQSYESDSSTEPLTGCQEERISTTLKNEMHTMILIEGGWPTKPDKYACDISKNYSDANHNMYCSVNRPCHCVQDFLCCDPNTPDLLPNQSCDAKCGVDRHQLLNYSCSSYANRWITPDHESAAVNITTEELPSNTLNRTKFPTALIVAIPFVGLAVFLGILWLGCFVQRRRRLRGRDIPEHEVRIPPANMSNNDNRNNDDENRPENVYSMPNERDVPEENLDDENRNGNDTPDERHNPGRASPTGPRVLQKIERKTTKATNVINLQGNENIHLHIYNEKNDNSPNEHSDPRNIAAQSPKRKNTDEEPTLRTPVQEQDDLDKNRYSAIPLMDADYADDDEETEWKEIISCEETEPKLQDLKEVSL